jgi:hypothetical protein
MTQPPVDPPEEPLGGSLTPPPEEAPHQPPPPPPPPPAEPPTYLPPPPPPAGSYPPPPPPPPPPATPSGYPMAPPEGVYPPAFPPGPGAGYGAVGLKPHRANLVLGLGIVGLLCCGPLGIVAYIFGKNDLAEMDAGAMDPSGRGTTNVGRILGIVAIVFLVIQVGYGIVAVATGTFGA